MRIVHLDARRLTLLSPSESAARWLSVLAAAGVVRVSDAAAGSVRAQMSDLYEGVWSVVRLEEIIAAGRVTHRIHLAPPAGWWFWMPIGYVLSFLIALSQDPFEDRLLTFGVLLNVLVAAALGLMAWVLAATWSWRRERRREAAAAAAERAEQLAALTRQLAVLTEQTFALCSGDRLLVSCPDLRWVEDALRDLPPVGHDARQAALLEARQALRAAIQDMAHQSEPDSSRLRIDRSAVPG